jgi:hypothetical protein
MCVRVCVFFFVCFSRGAFGHTLTSPGGGSVGSVTLLTWSCSAEIVLKCATSCAEKEGGGRWGEGVDETHNNPHVLRHF